MGRIRELWGRGIVGKAAIVGGGILGLFVVCCVIGAILGPQQQTAGSPTATSIPSVTAAQNTVEPSVVPAPSAPPVIEPTPYPTLTADQLSAFQTIARYSAAMKAAGEQLIGQPEDVKAAAQVLIDGQKAISDTHLPDWYSPLTERAASITEQCAVVAEAILAGDTITADQEVIVQRWCITEMGRLQLQAENP